MRLVVVAEVVERESAHPERGAEKGTSMEKGPLPETGTWIVEVTTIDIAARLLLLLLLLRVVVMKIPARQRHLLVLLRLLIVLLLLTKHLRLLRLRLTVPTATHAQRRTHPPDPSLRRLREHRQRLLLLLLLIAVLLRHRLVLLLRLLGLRVSSIRKQLRRDMLRQRPNRRPALQRIAAAATRVRITTLRARALPAASRGRVPMQTVRLLLRRVRTSTRSSSTAGNPILVRTSVARLLPAQRHLLLLLLLLIPLRSSRRWGKSHLRRHG